MWFAWLGYSSSQLLQPPLLPQGQEEDSSEFCTNHKSTQGCVIPWQYLYSSFSLHSQHGNTICKVLLSMSSSQPVHFSLPGTFKNVIKMLLCRAPSQSKGSSLCMSAQTHLFTHTFKYCQHSPVSVIMILFPFSYIETPRLKHLIYYFFTHSGCHRSYSLPDCHKCSPAWIIPDCLSCIWRQWGFSWLSKNSSPSALTALSTTAGCLAGLAWERFEITVFIIIILMQILLW